MIGENIFLRALEPKDIDCLFDWENDPEIWRAGTTITPFSRFILEQYIMNSHEDIFTSKQLRLMIGLKNNPDESIGAIDLFDFDPLNKKAGISILIQSNYRNKGYASESLQLIAEYAFQTLNLHQLYCSIEATNLASIQLFLKNSYSICGQRKDWLLRDGKYCDEYFLQYIAKD